MVKATCSLFEIEPYSSYVRVRMPNQGVRPNCGALEETEQDGLSGKKHGRGGVSPPGRGITALIRRLQD